MEYTPDCKDCIRSQKLKENKNIAWLQKRSARDWKGHRPLLWRQTDCWRLEGCLAGLRLRAQSRTWLRHQMETFSALLAFHSVESPSTVEPQWYIWYWGSKWNLHTVCWSAVGCEWGTTSVYFGITYVCFIPSRLPVFAVEPQYLLQDFLFLSKVSFEGHIQNLQKISWWFKIWMGFLGPKLIKLWTSSIWGFL